jgi:uncharacterized membrane protein
MALTLPSFAQTIISASNSSWIGQNISVIGLSVSNGPQYSYNIPISGRISFDPNNYNKVSSVTRLTIYARAADGFDNWTNPTSNGTFSLIVPDNGEYSIFVYPSTLDYLNNSTNIPYSIVYPDESNPFVQYVTNDSGVTGMVIPTQYIQTGLPMNATPIPPTVTPSSTTATPTPGLTAVAVLAVLGIVTAIAYSRK